MILFRRSRDRDHGDQEVEHRQLKVGRWWGAWLVMVATPSCGASEHVLGYKSPQVDGGPDVAQESDQGSPFVTVETTSGEDGNSGGDVTPGDSNGLAPEASSQCGVCPQGEHCDPTLGCVACTADSHCPASARFCVLGSCVQCRTSSDCGGTTPSCWPGSQTCRPACTSNQQCAQDGNARICNASTGACVGCNVSADCPTAESVCEATTQQCVQCSSGADCVGTSTPACLRNHCVQCATNGDCPSATPYCALGGDSPGHCVQCLQNAQCPPSAPMCNSGTCGKSGS
jgi:hypothetical protein